MKPIDGKAGVVARLSLAAGLLGATALAVASAAPLGPQAGLEADSGLLIQVKKGKGKHHHHHHHHDHIWTGIGAAIVLSTAYCAVQAESCRDRYGDSHRYWRCVRRAGCAGDDW